MTSEVTGNALLKSITLLAVIAPIVLAQQYSAVLFESYSHECRAEYFQSMTLQLVNYSNGNVLDGCFPFSRNIEAVDVRFEAVVAKKGAKPWILLNVTLDACKLIDSSGPASRQLIQLIVRSLKSSSPKFPDKCPMEKGKEYCFTNFSMDAVKLPTYLPETKLNFTYNILYKKINISKFTIVVKVQRKGN